MRNSRGKRVWATGGESSGRCRWSKVPRDHSRSVTSSPGVDALIRTRHSRLEVMVWPLRGL